MHTTTAVCFLVLFTAVGTYFLADHLDGDRDIRGDIHNELEEEEVLKGNEKTRAVDADDHVEEGSERIGMKGDFGGVGVAKIFGDFSSTGPGGVKGDRR